MPPAQEIDAAYRTVRHDLLAERPDDGVWEGRLASSALSTATAVSALSLVRRQRDGDDPVLNGLVDRGVRWISSQQNDDGGWGDTDRSYSNVATTMLVVSALHLADRALEASAALDRAESYLDGAGRIDGLRARYGRDRTFAVPILTNAALANQAEWKEVKPLPFEAACLPQRFYRFVRLPVVSYAIPALVAIGQARFVHRPPWNPLLRAVRAASVGRSLRVLERMQPESGGYLEAIPLTSFVVMSLAATGASGHAVARRGVAFLKATARRDGSWPIDTNLALWNTTLAVQALTDGGGRVDAASSLIDYLLGAQYRERHPYTGASPGGWGWSDLTGAVPDADDTPGAMLALSRLKKQAEEDGEWSAERRRQVEEAVQHGAAWLLDLQNRDGGWPTFCRGWGKLPFDRSGSDLTAHAMRALGNWRRILPQRRVDRALRRGRSFLDRSRLEDGSWLPLWFGNQDDPREANPVYGTSRVLLALSELGESETTVARRGWDWLEGAVRPDGGWGGNPHGEAGFEETALAVQALLARPPRATDGSAQTAAAQGVRWLVQAVGEGRHREPAPIGFYFARLWYYERLYPLIFAASALGRARSRTADAP